MTDVGKILAIVNPVSGTGDKSQLSALIAEVLGGRSLDVETTRYAGHARELAREAVEAGYGCVVAIGGDGTVNEVASELAQSDVALGVVPCGSGNGLARHLHIPLNTAAALQVVADGYNEWVDYCTACDRIFVCTCGVGFDAQVSQRFALEDTRGLVTYVRTTIEEYFRYRAKHYRITIDGERLEENAFVIACCNAAQYGNNARVAPRASMRDGMIDMTVIHSFTLPEAALLSARLFTSTIEHDRNVSIYRGREIVIERDEPDVMHIDGDPVEMPARINIKCHHMGLRVIVPANTGAGI